MHIHVYIHIHIHTLYIHAIISYCIIRSYSDLYSMRQPSEALLAHWSEPAFCTSLRYGARSKTRSPQGRRTIRLSKTRFFLESFLKWPADITGRISFLHGLWVLA